MKTYRKMLAVMAALVAVTVGAVATPLYYTIFHALEEDTMKVFRYRGEGSVMLSTDGGSSYETISSFRFDKRGRGIAKVFELNDAPGDALVKLVASFNETATGQPADTVIETSVDEFVDSLMRYKRKPWLAYSPVYVSYLPDIVDTAIEAGSFSILIQAVQTAGLEETLRGEGPFTVFAPTDDAFTALLGQLGVGAEELLADPELGSILLYHVVGAALDGDTVSAETHIETVLGKDVDVEIVGNDLFINDSKVIVADIEASNGIIHVIDTVLIPA
jgi:uncharacterized surface protein with fasciclin (FAS1) repeats